jgi:4-alpha-glucanotransferase
MLQVLPVNDTSVFGDWHDSYPYRSISVYALHPMYLSLPELVQGSQPQAMVDALSEARSKSSEPVDMNYEETMRVKLDVARAVFDGPQGPRCAFPTAEP